jgi:hypothetical protein
MRRITVDQSDCQMISWLTANNIHRRVVFSTQVLRAIRWVSSTDEWPRACQFVPVSGSKVKALALGLLKKL